ncbi:HsdM family class I SAM-dependent methyltransferase [Sphingosinicella microcystinivorans]|uniref:HsdM family class I SAM-dependent methyltransferase n=1 Tax=Sphingosinicella microcystinivorans TaxID=335406 RepID=UPI0022F3AA79|nr:N-6 DNA methylase [Sphingosinicella microcystinivorans]WBX84580.1 N-6 DNA methylase [Sphingosinicella microcystinivorans]
MANERKTENLVRDRLRKLGYFADGALRVEEQRSDNPKISKLLKNASKRGTGIGLPEFVITSADFPDLIIVIECKGSPQRHRSAKLDQYADYACDGALLYASFLSKAYNVIAIGVSGETDAECTISHFLHLENEHSFTEFAGDALLIFDDYVKLFQSSPEKFNHDYSGLLTYTQKLNANLHKLKVKESQRSLLLSGILISLKNQSFIASYSKQKTALQLTQSLVQTIVNELVDDGIDKDRIQSLKNAYSFISSHAILSRKKEDLVELIQEIDKEINSFMRTYEYFDTIGQFYIEFLRYANNDKGLGIVLTPPHITELFADLAGVDANSVVWDNCCGTGGFLISAMKRMVADCKGDTSKVKKLKESQLFGSEIQDDIYALAISNMILQGDGKSGISPNSCFEDAARIKEKKPNVGLLNPPYKSNADDPEELDFILNNLSALEVNGTCVAIVPISTVLASDGPGLILKQRLMKEHTVEAVMSMPEDLFHNSDVGVITCTLVVTAHKPHAAGKKTWLGYWRDDGFVKQKGKGRIDAHHKWQSIKDTWLAAFKNREVDGRTSVMVELAASNEWCAEAYITTDYSTLTENEFARELRKYLSYRIGEGV